MTFEQALIAAIVFLTTFCGALLTIQRRRNEANEQFILATRLELQNKEGVIGLLKGALRIMRHCPQKTKCPYKEINVDKI